MPLKFWEREVAVRCMAVAWACDAIGEALDSEPVAFIEDYLEKEDYFPTNRNDHTRTGVGGINTDLSRMVLESLDDINPVEREDIRFFSDDFAKRIGGGFSHNKSTRLHEDFAHSFPIGVATGVYSSLQDVPYSLCIRLYDAAVAQYGIRAESDIECGRTVCFLVSSLIKTGYFGIETMQNLHDLDLYTDRFSYVVDEILAHPLDVDYLNGYMGESVMSGLTYSELVLADVFFHMARIDTGFRPHVLKSTANSQWGVMLPRATVNLSDLCFTFGAVCSASEHTRPLITKKLWQSVQGFDFLKSLLQ